MTINSNFQSGQILTAQELNSNFALAASEADGFFLANATGGTTSSTLGAANINGIYTVYGTTGTVTVTLALANIKPSGHATQVIRNSSSYPVIIAVQSGNNLDSQVTTIQPFQSAAYASDGNTYWHELWNEAGTPSLNTNLAYAATNSATLTGTTAGSIQYTMPEQGVAKKFVAYANGYENDTTTAQIIAFPQTFDNVPVVTTNTTGLTVSVSTTSMTVAAPDVTTLFNGLIIVEGI